MNWQIGKYPVTDDLQHPIEVTILLTRKLTDIVVSDRAICLFVSKEKLISKFEQVRIFTFLFQGQ